MKTIGFPISQKENEKRRALIPSDIKKIKDTNYIFIEKGYGDVLKIDDNEYKAVGCNIVERKDVFKCDIICDPKIGDAEYLYDLEKNKILFGWIHATQSKAITNILLEKEYSAFAWEKMFNEGRHVFWRNNELAGEAAILHAFQCYGKMPYETNVAVIGRGNTARGAIKILNMLGANIIQYGKNEERYIRNHIDKFDVIVNCVLWDVFRQDHIVYKEDLLRMKKDTLIIDVSCDRNGAIESSVPTTIENPVYTINGVLHYVVDHTPAIYFKTFSYNNSAIIYSYIDDLIHEKANEVLNNALIIKNGVIIDQEIIKYQNR